MIEKIFGKLTKLEIITAAGKFEVMFNPESYSENFSTVYRSKDTANSGVETFEYVKSIPQDFKLLIIIDNTGVTEYQVSFVPGLSALRETVYQKVNKFLRLTWLPSNGKPNELEIKWGEFSFHCWLKSVNIKYTLFDRNGDPLRAELDATFIGNSQKNEKNYRKRFQPGPLDLSEAESAGASDASGESTGSSQDGIVISVS